MPTQAVLLYAMIIMIEVCKKLYVARKAGRAVHLYVIIVIQRSGFNIKNQIFLDKAKKRD